MDLSAKKIIILLVFLLALEIPVLLFWSVIRDEKLSDMDGIVIQQAETETAAVPVIRETETTVPLETSTLQSPASETIVLPTEPDETVIPETEPEEAVPAQTEPAETIPERISIDQVPQFYQNDYPDERYGTSTVAQSGSNMTALAMVASFMTDHYYYPDEIADYLAHFSGFHYERLQYGSDLLQLSWKRAKDVRQAMQAVKDGKTAIILMNEKSIFPSAHHYIVLTGINEAGKYTVLDPNRDNYSSPGLEKHLEEGLTENLLLIGFEGGWIYDKSEMPEDPFIYEPEPPAKFCRYPEVELTETEMNLMAKVIYMEGASEPFKGQQAIAEVILNRLVSGDFQNSVYGIVHAVNQFPSVSQLDRAKPDYTQYKAIEQALYGPYVLPKDVVFYAKFAVNNNVWGKIGAHTFCYAY